MGGCCDVQVPFTNHWVRRGQCDEIKDRRTDTQRVRREQPLGTHENSPHAFLRDLGVEGAIRSPTYTLVERYPIPGGEAAHLDLYRLGDAAELDFLGLDALAADATLWLVEWPERGATGLPAPDLAIDLAVDGDGRTAVLDPASAVGADWLARTPS